MIVVYEADNLIEAHMLRGLLEQRGLRVNISGEYLLGAMGDLPARGLVRVLVPGEDWDRARQVVHEFEDNMAAGPSRLDEEALSLEALAQQNADASSLCPQSADRDPGAEESLDQQGLQGAHREHETPG